MIRTELEITPCEVDPLRSSVALPNQHVLFPYGLPLLIKSNHIVAIRVAESSWGSCRVRFQEKPIEIRILVTNVPPRRKPPQPIFRAQANLMTIVADAQNYACCDLTRGMGFAILSRAAIRDRDYLRYYFIEAMAYTLLDALHLVIFHAACVAFHSCGFILVGASGAGKSSLSYACAKRGWTYISDDATAVLRRRPNRVALGHPRTFRFRPAAAELFPEISGPIKLRNQKPTIEIPTESLSGIQTAESCNIHFILFLKRSTDPGCQAALMPISKESALRHLFYQILPDELGIAQDRFHAIESILNETRCYELIYRDLAATVDLLERLAAALP
ncbi:MAG: hypothetical protein JO061_04160 [Acidobacteriaceae bacterium]|nr:hypothetical protein [Acidobacteriaceae bacterium]